MNTKEKMLADLQAVASLNENGNLTRKAYREHGQFSSFEIEDMFGNFGEAKRQAGISLTRVQSQRLTRKFIRFGNGMR